MCECSLLRTLLEEQLALHIAERPQRQAAGGGGASGGGGGASGGGGGASGATLGVSSLPEAVEVARLFVWSSGSGNKAGVLHWSAACGAQPQRPPTAAELALPLCPICAGAAPAAIPQPNPCPTSNPDLTLPPTLPLTPTPNPQPQPQPNPNPDPHPLPKARLAGGLERGWQALPMG